MAETPAGVFINLLASSESALKFGNLSRLSRTRFAESRAI